MGTSQSLERIQTFYNYHKLVQNNQSLQRQDHQIYFGPEFQLYTNKFNPKEQFTKHVIKFQELKQMQNFILSIKLLIDNKDNLIPFNILYPLNIFVKDSHSLLQNMHGINCSDRGHEVIVVHKWLGRSLSGYVKDNKNSQMNQQSVWFIINQLSKSLEILQQHNHASYHIMPQNIWCNENQNWFLYDGRFVLGTEGVQLFYQHKLKSQQFMSDDMIRKVDSNSIITNNDSLQEDVYCFGYCVLFMVTGIHPKDLPAKPHERDALVQELLELIVERSPHHAHSKRQARSQFEIQQQPQKFSYQLISFIRNLIRPDPKRRFTIRQIRSYLKTKEQQIFIKQQQQWSKSQFSKTSSRHRNIQKNSKNVTNLIHSWSPNLHERVKNPQFDPKNRIMTEINSQRTSIYNNNFGEVRTLKKQQIPQKIIAVNDNKNKVFRRKPQHHYPHHNPNIVKNDPKISNINYQAHGEYTPIRMISDTNLNTNRFNFKSIQKIQKLQKSPITLQPESNLCDKIEAEIRQMNSPSGKCRNQLAYMSPKRDSTSSINTRAIESNNNGGHVMKKNNVAPYESKLTQGQSPKSHLGMNSPPHNQITLNQTSFNQGILSPGKVMYQSPRKAPL